MKNKKKSSCYLISHLTLLAFGCSLFISMSSFAASPYLFGDRDGKRLAQEESGYTFEATFTIDLMTNLEGGVDEGFDAPGNLDLIAGLDTGAAGWWNHGTFHLYLLANSGGDPSARIGDFQVASNIEAVNTFKVYEAWYEHRFLEDRFSILLGLHDYNSEFYVLEYAGLFINSSFGIGAEVAQVGPSIFATTALATRLAWQPTENTYLKTVVYDGVPGDPGDPRGTHINFDQGDGLFLGLEGALLRGGDPSTPGYYKLGLGGWYHTKEFEDFSGAMRDDNSGFYIIGEQLLFTEKDVSQGLGAFLQLGLTESDRNQVDLYIGAGIHYSGLLPGRDEDIVGLAFAHAGTSGNFIDANPGTEEGETVVELSCQFAVTPWLTVQPDLQYIIDPGMVNTVDDAVVFNLRLQINL